MFGNATRMVQTEPGVIVGPISRVLGFVLDFIFNIFYMVSPSVAFGISIIFFTIVIKLLLLPLGIKMHKSTLAMRKLQPQIQKINDKYGSTKDPDKVREKNVEIQKIYSENKANPLGGCLPALIQMPIFITLFNMFQRPYLYITKIGDIYREIGTYLVSLPEFFGIMESNPSLWIHRLPRNMVLDIRNQPDLLRLFNVYDKADWNNLFGFLPGTANIEKLTELISHKDVLEHFMTISLVTPSSLTSISVIIPILAGVTTYLSSRITMQQQAQAGSSDQQKMTQNMMMYGMPIMMAFITLSAPAGVGLYWIVSNLFTFCQSLVLNKMIKAE